MRFVFLLFFAILTTALHGDLDQHLKKALDKSGNHSMPGIDFIYVINLDQRPEKWKSTLDQLATYGINPYRFSGVNGWELSLETINDVGVKFSPEMEGGLMSTYYPLNGTFAWIHEPIENYGRTYFCHCTARGTIGISLSHISILQDAFDSGYETIWVMEDDIEIKRDPRILSEYIEKLDQLLGKDNWDILFTDRDIRGRDGNYVPASSAAKRPDFVSPNDFVTKTEISSDFRKIGSRYGAHSMILRKSGIKKLLRYLQAHQLFLPYDMEYTQPPGIALYTVLDDIVTNLSKALSDNGAPFYLDKKTKE